ncbi:hypothetical protein [Deinococcus sonorensis]|uniref:Uncharacterized protein n=2 Tax=Deinococcus sonorensis TaxID=309891 RepID=A0AAU7UAQ9_9DEIO
MRIVIAILLVVLAATLYFTGGIRLGMVTVMPTWLVNAQGASEYSYRMAGDSVPVQVKGTCNGKSGRIVLRLRDPAGNQVGGQECVRGDWAINLQGHNDPGSYRLTLEYDHFTGRVDVRHVQN